MVQAKGIRPLDSRLSAERDASSKYSTPARSRAFGLSAASRAIPTRGVGAGLSAQRVGMGHLRSWACAVSLFIRLLSRGDSRLRPPAGCPAPFADDTAGQQC